VVGGGSGPSADNAVRRHGFRRAADSEEAVITDQAIDAVVITTRHSSHARLAASALERGQNVFCEKPLALSVDDLHSVMSAARSSSGILAVGFNRRFSPMLSDLREFVRGDVVESPITATYRVSAGYVPEDHWLRDLEQGGGRVIGEICHFLDVLSFLTGSPIVEVYASGHDAVPSRLQACDNTVLTVRHADGSTGSIAYVAQSVPTIHKERLEVFGPGGIALLDDYRSLELHSASGKERRVERRQDKGHQQEVMAFLEGVRAGEPPVALDTVENVSLAALAAVESLRFGLPVRLDVHTDVGAPR
jgi:predicted dehydrogenase